MPKDSENTHSEATPHFDSRRDRVINDSLGTKMGVRIDRTKSNPYNVTSLNNEEMKDFEEITRGKVFEED